MSSSFCILRQRGTSRRFSRSVLKPTSGRWTGRIMKMIIVVRMLMRMMVIIKIMIVMRMAAPCARVPYKRRIPALGKAQLCRHLIIGIHVEAVIPTNHRLPKRILICNLDHQWVGFSSLTFPHLCSRVGLRFADENKKKSGGICSTDCTVKMEAMRVKRLG